MVEKPEDFRRVAGGTRESTERERQTSTVVKEKTQPEAMMLMDTAETVLYSMAAVEETTNQR